jgi:5-methylcytosine-specific restriction endonuclease McrA
MWSKHYDKCVVCGNTGYKHVSKGLCNSCYLAAYSKKHKLRIAKQKHKWYLKNVTREVLKVRREMRHFEGNREAVLRRDGMRCTECGNTRLLTVHHIDGNGRSCETPNNDMSNLTTLCRSCHIEIHRKDLQSGRFNPQEKTKRARKPPYKNKPIGKWARHYTACIICETTESKHDGKGLCRRCSQRRRLEMKI